MSPADGTIRPLPTAAFARHGHGAIGGMLPKRDLTQISLSADEWDRFWVCTAEGHLEDGSVYRVNGRDYRLTLVGSAQDFVRGMLEASVKEIAA